MAVAYETSAAPTFVTFLQAGETETVAFNAGTGANRVLFVLVTWRDRAQTTSGVTYNSVAMTALGAKVTNDPISARLYVLAGPASGSNNIAVTMESNGVSDSDGTISAWVANTVNQGTPTDGYTTNTGSGVTAGAVSSVTVTSATGDRVVIFMAWVSDAESNAVTTSTNYTERQDANNAGPYAVQFGDADGAASVAASATWDNGASNWDWIALGVNVKDVAAGGGNDLSVSLAEPVIGGSIF